MEIILFCDIYHFLYMGYFNNTLLGKIVLPRHKKVSGWLDDAYKYKVNEALKETFIAFCNQQKSIGYSVDETALLWIAVQINSLGNFDDEKITSDNDSKEWVKKMNYGAAGALPFLSGKSQREIMEIYLAASSKHLSEDELTEIWSI